MAHVRKFTAVSGLLIALSLLTACAKFRPSQMSYDEGKATEIALGTCRKQFGTPTKGATIKRLSIDFNADNGHWQVQHIGGAWTKDAAMVDSCIVVVDGVSGEVIQVRSA